MSTGGIVITHVLNIVIIIYQKANQPEQLGRWHIRHWNRRFFFVDAAPRRRIVHLDLGLCRPSQPLVVEFNRLLPIHMNIASEGTEYARGMTKDVHPRRDDSSWGDDPGFSLIGLMRHDASTGYLFDDERDAVQRDVREDTGNHTICNTTPPEM